MSCRYATFCVGGFKLPLQVGAGRHQLIPPSYRLFESPGDLHEASFIERPNRFVVRCDLDGTIIEAHCPNPGRLREILVPGTPLLVQKLSG